MKTKIILPTILILSFTIISSGLIYSGISYSDNKRNQTECPYLKGKLKKNCPYLDGKVDKSNSECPYSGKESKTDIETLLKEKSKEKKFYRTIKTIST